MLWFGRILQRQELDAFLAMSVSPLLHDVQTMQDLKVHDAFTLSLIILWETISLYLKARHWEIGVLKPLAVVDCSS